MDQNYCCCPKRELLIICQICAEKPQNPPCICQMDFKEGQCKLLGGLKPTILTGYKRLEMLQKRDEKQKKNLQKGQNEKPQSVSDDSSENESLHDQETEPNNQKRVRKSNQFWFDVSVKTRKLPGYAKKIGDKCNCQNESASQPSTSSKESIIQTTTFLTREKLPQASISFFQA